MNKPNLPPKPTTARADTVAATHVDTVAESSSSDAGPRSGPSAEELNDLNSKLAPALTRGDEFDALWSVWSERGDYVAATATSLAAAACRAAVDKIHAAWFMIRQMKLAIEDVDRPLVSTGTVDSLREGQTTAQALDRLVAEIAETDAETLASVERTFLQVGDRSVHERVKRLRGCSEWSNPKGILYNHPPSGCLALFHALLVSPPVYMEVRADLANIARFRREAIKFKETLEAHQKELQKHTDVGHVEAPQRATLSGLTLEESEQFRDLLDSICAGDVKTRHGNKDADRISTVRLIAEHFRMHSNLSRTVAAGWFKTEPWSTGFAVLACAALGYKVSTEEVRGALKNWASD